MNENTVRATTQRNCFVEEHHSTITRYFNGRRYTVSTHHDYYQYITPGIVAEVGHTFAVYFRYVMLHDTRHTGLSPKIGHVYKTFSGIRPTNLMRTMADMIPDDIQAVPF